MKAGLDWSEFRGMNDGMLGDNGGLVDDCSWRGAVDADGTLGDGGGLAAGSWEVEVDADGTLGDGGGLAAGGQEMRGGG